MGRQAQLPESVAALMDRVPPQNLDAEQSVLGSMMLEGPAREKGIEILTADDFYRPVHQEVFSALLDLAHRNEPTDLITLQEELRKRGKLDDCGGTEYLMSLAWPWWYDPKTDPHTKRQRRPAEMQEAAG